MKNDFLVSVRCISYNHASYIEDCMNGFTMQETDFPYVCVIDDDASTDGEPEVITNYLTEHFNMDDKDVVRSEETDDYRMIFAQHKTNKNCFFAVYFLKYNHYSIRKSREDYVARYVDGTKYMAICEGDDYWIDPLKLQKQVAYFGEHPNCGLVYTAYRLQNDVTGANRDVFTSDRIKHDNAFKWKLLEQSVMVGTCTILIDLKLYKEIHAIIDDYKGFLMGDTQTWFNASRLSEIGYIPIVTGVYRKQLFGATATFDVKRRAEFIRGCLDLDLHLAYKYGAPDETKIMIKRIFGFSALDLFLKRKDYETARKVNKEVFYNNYYISSLIRILEKMQISHLYGFRTILNILSKMGLIVLK